MKNIIKLLSIILTALLLFAAIPFAALAGEIDADTEDSETETIEIAQDVSTGPDLQPFENETSFDTEETETAIFEFIEEAQNNSRMIGDGEVGFGPPEDDSSTTLLITSVLCSERTQPYICTVDKSWLLYLLQRGIGYT